MVLSYRKSVQSLRGSVPLFPHLAHSWLKLRERIGSWIIFQLLPVLCLMIFLSSVNGPQSRSSTLVYLGTMLLVYFLVYYNIMIGIWESFDYTSSEQECSLDGLPDWRCICGVCLAGLLRGCPFILAFICAISFGNSNETQLPRQLEPGTNELVSFILLFLVKLPSFLLFALCINLAFRDTAVHRAIPVLVAIAGSVLACWSMVGSFWSAGFELYTSNDPIDYSVLYVSIVICLLIFLVDAFFKNASWKYQRIALLVLCLVIFSLPIQFDSGISAIVFVGLGSLLLLQTIIITSASQPPWSLNMLVLTTLFVFVSGCGIYTFIMLAKCGVEIYGYYALPDFFSTPLMLGMHFCLSHVFPGVTPYDHCQSYAGSPVLVCFYGIPKDRWYMASFITGAYLTGLSVWWITARCCLKAYRT